MKKIVALMLGTVALVGVTLSGSALAQPTIGLSIGFEQPGLFGRLHIGDGRPPVLLAPRPVFIAPPPVVVRAPEPFFYERDPRAVRGDRDVRYDRYGRYDRYDRYDHYDRDHRDARDHRPVDRRVDERHGGERPGSDRGQYRPPEPDRAGAHNRPFDDQPRGRR